MKLPIQARPILRSVSSAKISDALMNGVTASCNVGECGWIAGACVGTAIAAGLAGGPAAAAAAGSTCLAATTMTSPDCRPCVPELYVMMMDEVFKYLPSGDGRERPLPPRHNDAII